MFNLLPLKTDSSSKFQRQHVTNPRPWKTESKLSVHTPGRAAAPSGMLLTLASAGPEKDCPGKSRKSGPRGQFKPN